MKYILAPRATKDFGNIIDWVAGHNLTAAENLYSDFKKSFEYIASFPFAGSQKSEFTNKPYRWHYLQRYWITYNPNVTPVKIVRIINSYMDIPSRF
ncbi:MAG: type II toxin-antitoxin system RelE/ParE family toxin [Rickettsiales bacterium]|nr:type II toxin-antitoxin system RelE/ParE family toxin [Rickettsiales bacterium]